MDKASVYGTGDCRFESYQGQRFRNYLFPARRRESGIGTRQRRVGGLSAASVV